MALWDEVATRYAAQELIELTRTGGSTSDNTVDTTVGNAAAADIAAQFEILAGVAFSLADERHVAVAVEGVVTLLRSRAKGAQSTHKAYFEKWKAELREFGKVAGRNRVIPKSTSQFTKPDEVRAGQEVAPVFDATRFTDIIPDPPHSDYWTDRP